jgi:hypothetical protein
MRIGAMASVVFLFAVGCLAPPTTTVTQKEIYHDALTVTQTVTHEQTVTYTTSPPAIPPGITFNQDASARTLTVVSADGDADWHSIVATFPTACTLRLNHDGAVMSGGRVSGAAQSISAGDTLSIANCGNGNNALTLKFVSGTAQQTLGTWTFNFAAAAPNITFNQDNSGHSLTVVSADAQATWNSIRPTLSGCTATMKLNGQTLTSGQNAYGSGSHAVAAGDAISLSAAAGSSCTLSLTYTSVNQLLGTWTFTF